MGSRIRLQNIVVGVSEAATSRRAGEYAFELAELSGATVHVVTAVDDADTEVIEVGSDTFVVNDLDVAHDSVADWITSLSTTATWQVHAIGDKAADALVDVAEQVDADLIVVGNVRMQGFGRLLGSVGSDVVHHAPCSVLVVKTT